MNDTMVKRVVIETSLYYDENVTADVTIHSEDYMFSQAKQVKIQSKYDVFEVEVILKSTVTPGAIALNHFQNKKYHLKNYHSNFVTWYSSKKPSRTLFDIINERFNFKNRIGGMESVLEEIFVDVLLPRLYS
ncbi:unnamed protein product [Rotaria magnacalcarata]|uniref:Uncharacterized protein n=1 Tax=Rotaria magnacalcarata TaxID=392030 RepID=A0A815SZ38_9BILA|nr:unnamed protein product [Rotaria magnacalcarata]CAF3950763.1 unnamed protein product [Rotaria magnacalcarata]